MEHVDEVWDRLHFRTPWSAAREHERIRGRADPLPGVARRQPAQAGRHRGAVRDRRRPRRAASGCSSPATPTGSSSTPTAASWWSTSRPAERKPTGPVGAAPRPARRSTSSPSTTAPSTASAPDGHGESGGAELVQLGLPDGDAGAWCSSSRRRPTTAPSAPRCAQQARPCRRAGARRDLPRRRRRPLPRLRLRADLPDQERRVGDVPVTTTHGRSARPQELAAR